MDTLNIQQAKTQPSRIVDRAVAGEEIIIARNGRPLVRMVALEGLGPRTPGIAPGRITDLQPGPSRRTL